MSINLSKSKSHKIKAVIIDVDINIDSHVILSKIANSRGLKIEDIVIEAIQDFITKYLMPLYKVYST